MYLAHSVQIYHKNEGVSKVLTNCVVEKIANENIDLFNRVITNLPFYMKFPVMFIRENKYEDYNTSKIIVNEARKNPLLKEVLLENVHIDEGLNNLINLHSLERGTPLYNEVYDKAIQVGKYPIKTSPNIFNYEKIEETYK